MRGVRRVLDRLSQVISAVKNGETVHIVEGEKDADALAAIGLTATTSPGGSGRWRREHSESLSGARVVILPDTGVGYETMRRHYGRWLAGHDAEELQKLVDWAPRLKIIWKASAHRL